MNSFTMGRAYAPNTPQLPGVDKDCCMTILCTGFWRLCGQKPSAMKTSRGKEHRLRAKLETQIKQIPDLPCVAVAKSLNLSEFLSLCLK